MSHAGFTLYDFYSLKRLIHVTLNNVKSVGNLFPSCYTVSEHTLNCDSDRNESVCISSSKCSTIALLAGCYQCTIDWKVGFAIGVSKENK